MLCRSIASIILALTAWSARGNDPVDTTSLVQVGRIHGGLSPKSIAWNGHGLFFAQNMMYRHSVAVFDEAFQRCGTISDRVVLEDLGICDRPGSFRGSPVECVFSADGRYAYVSNYLMEGEDFSDPGCDGCHGAEYDGSYVYRINTATLQVDAAYPTGSVPKFLALTPDERTLLVSNWSSGDVSVIDLGCGQPAERIPVGRFPRGLAVDPAGRFAYVALMGGTSIKRIDLMTHAVEHFATVGRGPRHLIMDRTGTTLYASLNHEGAIASIDIASRKVTKLPVGGAPRSMVLGANDQCLYVVNYSAAQITKVTVEPFVVAATASTDSKPIGITYDARNGRIWVACYSGSLLIFEDREAPVSTGVDRTPLPVPQGPADSCMVRYAQAVEAPVRNAASLEAVSAPAAEPAPAPREGAYRVVAGGFRERSNADNHAARLVGLGFPAVIEVPDRTGALHQVVAGTYSTAAEAQLCRERLAEHAIAAWVKRP